ncbi:lipopolysaccharide transport periplasmic protein LptA [Litorisediminicola beolgyonensis]|uniref:Lipopolysaccharide transport periplasmic protein LptA n=1 Tax=Litorisediminicola beolgyonensis TaxID=1173614 RepID=A0ABW3ZHL3_9RHOB
MPSNLRLLAAAAALVLLAAPIHAQEVTFGTMRADSDAPVEVSADQLSVNQSDGTALYSGNVVIGQGEMRLSAPRVLVVYAETRNAIARLEATGGVTLVSGTEAAEAERADYDIDAGTVTMSGNVLLTQGDNALTSERMVVDLDSGTAQMDGRVRTVLQPGGSE